MSTPDYRRSDHIRALLVGLYLLTACALVAVVVVTAMGLPDAAIVGVGAIGAVWTATCGVLVVIAKRPTDNGKPASRVSGVAAEPATPVVRKRKSRGKRNVTTGHG